MFVFFLLALLALLFVLAPVWPSPRRCPLSRNGASQNTAREEAAVQSRAWYDQRMRELAEEEMDEAQQTELLDELASVLLAEYPNAEAPFDDKEQVALHPKSLLSSPDRQTFY